MGAGAGGVGARQAERPSCLVAMPAKAIGGRTSDAGDDGYREAASHRPR